jgi:hypothetical protein
MPTIKIVPMPGVAIPGPQGPRGYQGEPGLPGSDANTGDIEFSGNSLTAHGDISIGVDVVPGEISLSAYNGVNLQFAQSHQGAGLHFPDGSTQTTAYPGSIFPEPTDWTPVISSTNFAQTSNAATGHYMAYGKMIVVDAMIPFSNVTNFGSGQYSLSLPFPAARHGDAILGTLHSETNGYYTLKGHYDANDTSMSLWYISIVSKDAEFDHNSPVLLTTADHFHINFIYEAA